MKNANRIKRLTLIDMDGLPAYTLPFGACFAGSALLNLWAMRPQSRLPYPRGPKDLPIVGDLLDMPKEKVADSNERWYRYYRSLSE